MANTTTWRCRQCLSNGTTADFKSYAHMKSHLAGHGYGPWRCTGCDHIGRRREAITAHHRAIDERDAVAYNDPALTERINNEVRECRLPHQAPWTGPSAVPPPDAAALAAAEEAEYRPAQASMSDRTVPMPLALIAAQAVNAVMPMINHLSMSHHVQHQERVESWVMLLRTRLNHIDDAESLFEIALRLQRLGETVALHSDILTSERDIEALRATSLVVENLKREASRD